MPGKLVRVLVAAGQQVQAGQGLVVMEAMKMENELRRRAPGACAEVHVASARRWRRAPCWWCWSSSPGRR